MCSIYVMRPARRPRARHGAGEPAARPITRPRLIGVPTATSSSSSSCPRVSGGRPGRTMEVPTLPLPAPRDSRPLMTSSPIRCPHPYLLDLLPRSLTRARDAAPAFPGRLLAVGIAAVIAGHGRSPRSASGRRAGPEALTALGAVRGPADESTFRRLRAGQRRCLDRVLADLLDLVVLAGAAVPRRRPSGASGRRPRTWSRRWLTASARPRRSRGGTRDPRGAGAAEAFADLPRGLTIDACTPSRHRAAHPRRRRLRDDRQGQMPTLRS